MFIYINDIVKDIKSIIKLLADNTIMSRAMNKPDLMVKILNTDLEKSKCGHTHGLLVFSNKQKPRPNLLLT